MALLDVEEFIRRWQPSGGSERANFQQFAIELTQLLGVEGPKPATADRQNDDYRFERPVTFIHTGAQSHGFVDLYRRNCFVMEAKQATGKGGDPDTTQLTLLPDEPQTLRHAIMLNCSMGADGGQFSDVHPDPPTVARNGRHDGNRGRMASGGGGKA